MSGEPGAALEALWQTGHEAGACALGLLPGGVIVPHCDDPYACDFKEHCWCHLPEPSIFNLRGRGIDKWELYRKGILTLADVPLGALNAAQRMQVEYFLGRKEHTDAGKVREFLGRLRYPLCFLDFEMFNSAIPRYDGIRPYHLIEGRSTVIVARYCPIAAPTRWGGSSYGARDCCTTSLRFLEDGCPEIEPGRVRELIRIRSSGASSSAGPSAHGWR